MTYKWDQLTRRQQDAARRVASGALKEVPAASVSQVAKYLDECLAFERGEVTLDELYATTEWAR